MPSEVYSDLGTSIVCAGNVIKDFLNDHKSRLYMAENGIKELKFEQYYAGNSSLGGIVESMVKLAKKLIFGAIKNNVLDYFQFESVIVEATHLINKRPVSFQNSLRDSSDIVPRAITPELLLHGYDLPTLNCVPSFQPTEQTDPDYSPHQIRNTFLKLQKIRENLIEIYQNEFLAQLVYQATDAKDRFKPVKHTKLSNNDVILLREPHTKPQNYPLARVIDVTVNRLGEVTAVQAMKGNNREVVRRHVSSVIPLLRGEEDETIQLVESVSNETKTPKMKRRAAISAKKLIAQQSKE